MIKIGLLKLFTHISACKIKPGFKNEAPDLLSSSVTGYKE